MGLPPFERESLGDEYWSLWQPTKLPLDVELLADGKIKRNIWKYRNQTEKPKLSLKMLIKKLFFKKQYFLSWKRII
jgi:hypothetical protein